MNDLLVSHGTSVAPDALWMRVDRLRTAANYLDQARLWLRRVARGGSADAAQLWSAFTEPLETVQRQLDECWQRANELRLALERSIEEYTAVEERNQRVLRASAETLGWIIGFAQELPGAQFLGVAVGLGAGATIAIGGAVLGAASAQLRDEFLARAAGFGVDGVAQFSRGHAAAERIRHGVTEPWSLLAAGSEAAGSEAAGPSGKPGAQSPDSAVEQATAELASVLLGMTALLGRVSASAELVSTQQISRSQTLPPRSISELVARIPSGESQLRIERYETDGQQRWVAYIAGTQSLGMATDAEPFDMASNLQAVGDRPAASENAVRQALLAAGVHAGDQLVLVGHSQGGLVAARLAESGDFHVVQCVTVGAPLGPIADDTPTLAIVHRGDVVPGLGGTALPPPQRITVQATAAMPADSGLMDEHSLDRYRQTAALVDQSSDPELQAARTRLGAFASGTGVATAWLARRRTN